MYSFPGHNLDNFFSGKSTLACALDHALLSRGKLSYVLDGDNLRHGLNNNLSFSAEDRTENIRRVGKIMTAQSYVLFFCKSPCA